jgi:hypothetical protein
MEAVGTRGQPCRWPKSLLPRSINRERHKSLSNTVRGRELLMQIRRFDKSWRASVLKSSRLGWEIGQ